MNNEKSKRKKKKSVGIFNRIFKFRWSEERLEMAGTAEFLDIPPGSHHFVCDAHCRVLLFTDSKSPRTTYVFKQGRWRVVIPGDVLVSVQCADNVRWQFDLSTAAEKVDPTRVEVPIEIQAKNKAHSNLRYMIDRFMRGQIAIDKSKFVDDDGSDDDSFDDQDHPYTRYEQAAIDEEVAKAQKAAQASSSTSPSPGATEQPAPGAPQPGEVK